MKIGMNASFLRKPGTGIGQVSFNFLQKLIEAQVHDQQLTKHQFVLYVEEQPKLDFILPKNFHIRAFLPLWKRDDLIRKMLWERRVATMAKRDHCDTFLSLYQVSTVMPKNIRHTMVVHDIIPRLFPEYRGNMRQAIHWALVEQGIQSADRIVAISENTKKDLLREFNMHTEKISVVYLDVHPQFHNTISPQAVTSVLEKYHLIPGYIYHGGGLEIRKNAETLLRAYVLLLKKKKDSPQLVISGKIFDRANKLATDVVEFIKELQLEDKVKLLGFVPDNDLPALYSGALFFVYPSLYEGFGLPVLEALSMHIPVLSSDASSLPEVGGEATLYTNPNNKEEMAHQMERLILDESLRENLISRSASQAVQFSWEQFVQKVLAIVTRS